MNRIIDGILGNHLNHQGTLSIGQQGLVPYVSYDGSTNYSYHIDPQYGGVNGFTIGGWFYSSATDGTYIGYWLPATNNRVWKLNLATSKPNFSVSNDGTAITSVLADNTITLSKFYFLAARYTPSTELALWVNDVKKVNTTAIPANLFVSASAFLTLGAVGGATEPTLTGRIACNFFSSIALSDIYLTSIYNMGKPLFNL